MKVISLKNSSMTRSIVKKQQHFVSSLSVNISVKDLIKSLIECRYIYRSIFMIKIRNGPNVFGNAVGLF